MVKEEVEIGSVNVISQGEPMSVEIPDPAPEVPASEPMALDDSENDSKPIVRSKNSSSSSSATPPSEQEDGPSTPSSKKRSPSPAAMPAQTRKPPAGAVQLIGDLPIYRKDALATFKEIPCNNYQNKSIGRSKEMFESMTCDCAYEHGVDDPDNACGPWSNCINRLTQVECMADDCRCRRHCQNQRFQQQQYANIEIVLTEMKGFGLRAEDNLPRDTFIYEYVGDVVSPPNFKKRMRDYALEGIQHFYFMMLQKDEFIDATKSGGIGRFANHSCNPNCYVAKWTVGNYVRMGIFAKRDIKKHEELTFNYNVDRYGHQAQACYCGEPNCVGFIGGKTQTDIVTMDDLYLDALGITDENDVAELRGTKKKKGKKIDDMDFMPQRKPVVESEVPKVVQAIRQTTSKKVLLNILTRLKITEDQAALRQIMRLRGYSVMKNVLDDWIDDFELVDTAIQCLKMWPLLNRNKVDDSMIAGSVESLLEKHPSQEAFQTMVRELLEHWKGLPVYNRIKKTKIALEPRKDDSPTESNIDSAKRKAEEDSRMEAFLEKRKQAMKKELESRNLGYSGHFGGGMGGGGLHDGNRRFGNNGPQVPDVKSFLAPPSTLPSVDASAEHRQTIKDIIARAAAKEEEERRLAAEAVEAKAKKEAERAERHARRKAKAAMKKEVSGASAEQRAAEKAKNKEKRVMKLVGAVVVKCMSKYAKELTRDMFKKYAKELTQLIVDKEKKSSSYKDDRFEALSDDKVAKIKKFSKDFIAKVIRKLTERGKLPVSSASSTNGHRNGHAANGVKHRPSMSTTPTNATASSSTHTPQSVDGGDLSMNGCGEMAMSVEEAMGMDPDSDYDSDADAEGELEDAEGEVDEKVADDIPAPQLLSSDFGSMRPPPMKRPAEQSPHGASFGDEGMDFASGPPSSVVSEFGEDPSLGSAGWGMDSLDPRRRAGLSHSTTS